MSRTVVVMRGDGIGAIVVDAALRVLRASGFEAEFLDAEIGWSCWRRDGEPLPSRTIALLEKHRLGLLGAVTSKGKAEAEAELSAHLRGTGLVYRSAVLSLRQRFGLDICVRPCTSFPGNPLNFVRRLPGGGIEEPPLDITVFRQNTEGLYAGVEWTDPPAIVRSALAVHPRFAPFVATPGRDLAIATRIITREASRRIVDAAFRYAGERGVDSVVLAEKPNVLRETSGLVEDAAREVASRHPGIALRTMNIDAVIMAMVRKPEALRVVVASNLFGDILSDAAAGLTGGLGFAASANLGPDVAIFEPTHGSAPRHDGYDPPRANPIAAILACALLAEHAGDPEAAARLRVAIAAVVAKGEVRTRDMGGDADTAAMTGAILACL